MVILATLFSVCHGDSFIVKLSGSLNPAPFSAPQPKEILTSVGQEFSVSYSNPIGTHLVTESSAGWIMLEVTERRSQFIALCIRMNGPCEAKFKPDTREVTIVGDSVDMDGLNYYENVLLLDKPAGANVHATVIMLNGRVAGGTTTAKIGFYAQNPLCMKCVADNGGCESAVQCVCKKGYFGRTCSKRVTRVASETTNDIRTLAQFETMHVEDFYDVGDSDTQFTMKTQQNPQVLFWVNQNDEQDYNISFGEDRGTNSFVFFVEKWAGSTKLISLGIQKKWMISSVMNLSPQPITLELMMFRIRNNVFKTVSLILYILMVVAVALLVALSVCVICIKMRANARVRQAALAAKNSELEAKLTEKEIEKYLPIIEKKDNQAAFKDSCTICLENNDNSKPVRMVTLCGHYFHSECLLDWTKQKEFCPNCKKDFSKKAIHEFENPQKIENESKAKLKSSENGSPSQAPRSPPLQSSLAQPNHRPIFVRSVVNQQADSASNRILTLDQNGVERHQRNISTQDSQINLVGQRAQNTVYTGRAPSGNLRGTRQRDRAPFTLEQELLSENRPVLATEARRTQNRLSTGQQGGTSIRVEDRAGRPEVDDFQTLVM